MNALQLYVRLIRISMQARLQYRVDFIMGILNVVAMNAINQKRQQESNYSPKEAVEAIPGKPSGARSGSGRLVVRRRPG